MITCPIDGLPTSEKHLLRRPLAVMIENSPAARPQSGLTKACVVYEAITEGGITRFLAIYLHNDAEIIGPVRSARPHFISLEREYNAAYTHCGQSFEALQILAEDSSIYNLDQMKYDKPFWRDHTRYAPHNLYTSTKKLYTQIQKLSWDGPESMLPSFTSKLPFSGLPAPILFIQFPSAAKYSLRMVYDAKFGGYLRYEDGKLLLDRETKEPIVAHNVIVQYVHDMPFDTSKFGTFDVAVIGNATGFFFREGQYIPIKVHKHNERAITEFTTSDGKPLPYKPGQTWVEIVPIDGIVRVEKTNIVP